MYKTASKHARSRKRGEAFHDKSGTSTFLVPECDTPRELASFAENLETQISNSSKQLVLNFVGMQSISSDAALLIHDVLSQRNSETQIVTQARSPITGSGVLLWLVGDVRQIRPTAWLRFDVAKHNHCRRVFSWDEPVEAWRGDSEEGGRAHFDPNTQAVLRLIDKHLPVRLLAGRILTPHILGEYCLLSE